MSFIGFDADTDCTHIAPLAYERGARWVGRYLKNSSPQEIAALRAAGLAVLLIWETTAQRALTGTSGGAADGGVAVRVTKGLGAPPGTAVAMTADFDPERQQIEEVHEYMAAALAALAAGGFRMIVYGAAASGLDGVPLWLPNNAWTGNKLAIGTGKAAIVQDNGDKRNLNLGIDIDSDVAMVDDLSTLGMWMPAAAAVATEPQIQPATQMLIPGCRDLQAALVRAGYQIKVDGIFGSQTTGALADYYRRR